MTATLSDPSRAPRRPAEHRARPPADADRAGRVPRHRTLNTPGTLRALLAALVLLSLAWGALGGWVASQHSSAAGALVNVDEPLSGDARQMFQSIADADVTITSALLASSEPPLSETSRFCGSTEVARSWTTAMPALRSVS